MAIRTRFDAARAAEIINAIGAGRPIPPPPGGHWDDIDALLVAGCLAFAVRGTAIAALTREKPTHRERAEMIALMAQGDVASAIFWYADLAQALQIGTYEGRYEPVVEAVIRTDNDVPEALAVRGVKPKPGTAGRRIE